MAIARATKVMLTWITVVCCCLCLNSSTL